MSESRGVQEAGQRESTVYCVVLTGYWKGPRVSVRSTQLFYLELAVDDVLELAVHDVAA
jgi:hypothetical protein